MGERKQSIPRILTEYGKNTWTSITSVFSTKYNKDTIFIQIMIFLEFPVSKQIVFKCKK